MSDTDVSWKTLLRILLCGAYCCVC